MSEYLKNTLPWIYKSSNWGHRSSGSDVSIKVGANERKRFKLNFTFRNKSKLVLGDYINIALASNRIYIKPNCDCSIGYKIKSSSSTASGYCEYPIALQHKSAMARFEGGHQLKWDDNYKLYYVELENKR